MLFKPEDAGAAVLKLVSTHAFKSAATVMQGMAQHMDFGVAPLDHLAVHPDFAVAVIEWGGGCCRHERILW